MKAIAEVQRLYEEQALQKGFNALIYGPSGSGKTTMATTARRPIYIYCFDPRGEVSIRDEIHEGWVIADTRFQNDDIREPKTFKAWERDYREKKANGFFNMFATLVVDSLTTLGTLAMNQVLKDMGRTVGKIVEYEKKKIESYGLPFQQDYGPQMSILEHYVRDMIALPIDVIFTAHPDENKTDEGKLISIEPMVTGKLKKRLPLLFTELYVTQVKASPQGPTYKLLTRNDGYWAARTRIGRKGMFETYEEPDIKYILKKAGYPTEDKEMSWLKK